MEVKYKMTKNMQVVTISTRLETVKSIFDKTKTWTIYIIDNHGAPLGVITQNDYAKRSGGGVTKAEDIMTRGAYCVNVNDELSKAREIMKRHRITSLGVTEKNKLCGVLIWKDVFENYSATAPLRQYAYAEASRRNTYPNSAASHNNGASLVFLSILVILGIYIFLTYAPNQHISTNTAENIPVNPVPSLSDLFNQPEDLSSQGPPQAIYLTEEIADEINQKYLVQSTEFCFCLYGKKYKNGFLITSASEPTTYTSSYKLVVAEDCAGNSAGFIHSHPQEDGCILSDSLETGGDSDVSTLLNRKQPIMGVVCGSGRYAFYSRLAVNLNNPVGSSIPMIPVYIVNLDQNNNIVNKTEVTLSNPCQDDRLCNGKCWHGCTSQGTWTCTSAGGTCVYTPGVTSCAQ